jgi:hypothetical protein
VSTGSQPGQRDSDPESGELFEVNVWSYVASSSRAGIPTTSALVIFVIHNFLFSPGHSTSPSPGTKAERSAGRAKYYSAGGEAKLSNSRPARGEKVTGSRDLNRRRASGGNWPNWDTPSIANSEQKSGQQCAQRSKSRWSLLFYLSSLSFGLYLMIKTKGMLGELIRPMKHCKLQWVHYISYLRAYKPTINPRISLLFPSQCYNKCFNTGREPENLLHDRHRLPPKIL